MRIAPLVTVFLMLSVALFGQKQTYKSALIGFYNLENLYDTTDNPAVNDDEFTPKGGKNYNSQIYYSKIEHLATVISQIGVEQNPDGPALLGVAEIENDTVLTDLAKSPLIAKRNYQFVHYDSRDLRGVDVALFYNPRYFKVIKSDKLFVKLPSGSKDSYFTRDVLWVQGTLDGDTINVYVNHWPSRSGGEMRSAPGRAAAALVSKLHSDSLIRENPDAKIIIMGDLNDDPISPSMVKVLKTKSDKRKIGPGQLFNPWVDMYNKGYGTIAYQDAWGLFDQIVFSSPFLNNNQNGWFYRKQYIFNREFMVENVGRFKGYPMRTWDGNTYRAGYSDHFPTYIELLKKAN